MRLEVRATCTGSREVELEDLVELQGELKSLSEEAFVKLRKEILLHGISFTLHIWKNKGQNFVIDGHQRLRTLRRMKEEGILIPKVPISDVAAKDVKEAKQKILAGASQYGQVERDGLYQFLHEAEIDFFHVNSLCQFPEVDLPSFHAEFFQETVAKEEDPRGEAVPPVAPPSGEIPPSEKPEDLETEVTPPDERRPMDPDEPIGSFKDKAPPREPDDRVDITFRFLPEEKQELMWKCDELMKDFKVFSHAEVIFALVAEAHRKLKAKEKK